MLATLAIFCKDEIAHDFGTHTHTHCQILRKFEVWNDAKVRKSCRSRKMLQIDYALATFGFDTADN